MVAFYSGALRCRAFCEKLPGDHAFTDVYAAVVRNAGFCNAVSTGFINFRDAPSQKIIPKMAEVQWFIGIGRRIFNHHLLSILLLAAEIFIVEMMKKEIQPNLI